MTLKQKSLHIYDKKNVGIILPVLKTRRNAIKKNNSIFNEITVFSCIINRFENICLRCLDFTVTKSSKNSLSNHDNWRIIITLISPHIHTTHSCSTSLIFYSRKWQFWNLADFTWCSSTRGFSWRCDWRGFVLGCGSTVYDWHGVFPPGCIPLFPTSEPGPGSSGPVHLYSTRTDRN